MHVEIYAKSDLENSRGKTSRVTDGNIAIEIEDGHLQIKASQLDFTEGGSNPVLGDPSKIITRDAYILLTRDDLFKIIAIAVESGFITSIPLRQNL